MSRSPGVLHVEGRITMSYDGNEDDLSDASDDDDNDMWLDYSGDGGGRVRSKRPKTNEATIVDANGGKHKCKGQFPLLDSYWTVKAKIQKSWLQAPPAYLIKQNEGLKSWHVDVFLDDCLKIMNVELRSPVKSCFEIFCRRNLGGEALTFFNLESKLKDYVKSEGEQCSFAKCPSGNDVGKLIPTNHGLAIENCVFKSGLGMTVLRAVSHPELVECVSKLLPFSFQDFLCKLDPSKLDLALDTAVSSPWEFGFRQILFQKLRIRGAEASLSTYEKAGYLSRTTQTEMDALYIYEVLKVDAQRDGHMYMPFQRLTTYYHFKKLKYRITKTERWKKALDYLDKKKIIVREMFDRDTNIFLFHNWRAEMDTVEGLQRVITQYVPDKDNLDADLTSSDFDKVRGDPDQLKATELITDFPVVILSGMGGCGKTTVVTNLLKHVCDREETKLSQDQNSAVMDKEVNILKQQEISSSSVKKHDSSITSHSEAENSNGGENSLSKQQTKPGRCHEEHQPEPPPPITTADSDDEDVKFSDQKIFRYGGEEPSSSQTESKQGRLRRELMEDLMKVLQERKNEDSESMKAFKRQFLLVAPTGKAARLLGCKARLPSATIHSVVMSWRLWGERRQDEDEEEGKEWTYGMVKVLVVDECSLLSVRLFAAILTILIKDADLSKIILLGDLKQLPSIEPGDFLQSMFKAFSKASLGFSIELTQNHRSESKLIVENAKRISSNLMPVFDDDQRFSFIELEENADDIDRDNAICRLLQDNWDLDCHIQSQFVALRNNHCLVINELCSKHYNRHSLKTTTRKKGGRSVEVLHFEPGDKICFGKNQRVRNCESILKEYIDEIQHLLNVADSKASLWKDEKSQDGSVSQREIITTRTGMSVAEVTSLFAEDDDENLDKTVNELREKEATCREKRRARAAQKQKEWKEQYNSGGQTSGENEKGKDGSNKLSSSTNEEKLCNGEVFFIMDEKEVVAADNKSTNYFILSDRDPILPRVVCVQEKTLRKDCKMKHSWARTIHTYQGSESSTVVFFLGQAFPQNWQHVYTAVTRGKNSVCIVGQRKQLRIAVERHNVSRYSRLQTRLNDMLRKESEVVQRLIKHKKVPIGKRQIPKELSSSFANRGDALVSNMPGSVTQALNAADVFESTAHGNDVTMDDWSGEKVPVFTPSKRREVPSSSPSPPNVRMRTPKELPPSPVPSEFQSPPKKLCLKDTVVDTPFHDGFVTTLSLRTNMDDDEEDADHKDEDPIPSTSRENVKRRLL